MSTQNISFYGKQTKLSFNFHQVCTYWFYLNVTASQIQNLLTCILKPSLGYYGTFTFCRLDTFMIFFNKRSNRNFVKNCCKLLKGNLLPNQENSSNACWEFRITLCDSICIIWRYFSTLWPLPLNFRLITTNIKVSKI